MANITATKNRNSIWNRPTPPSSCPWRVNRENILFIVYRRNCWKKPQINRESIRRLGSQFVIMSPPNSLNLVIQTEYIFTPTNTQPSGCLNVFTNNLTKIWFIWAQNDRNGFTCSIYECMMPYLPKHNKVAQNG